MVPKVGEMMMRKLVITAVVLIILIKLGLQAALAALAITAIVQFGPKRLRRLPRQVREEGAVHMLMMLAAATAAIGLSAASVLARSVELAAMASLGSWLLDAAVLLVAVFHLVNLPIKPVARAVRVNRPMSLKQMRTTPTTPSLPKAG
ncbi:MAG TPA: hypothetical protein PLP86_08735 [Armatimonadota bacterium]|nr:hypothetical protein [Armatimonadota bacterium]